MRDELSFIPTSLIASLALLAVALPASADPGYDSQVEGRYGYVRVVEGALLAAHSQDRLQTGEVVLTGDRLAVERGSRAEVVLADLSRLRLAEDSEVLLAELAESADAPAANTRLVLTWGELQLDSSRWSDDTRIDTGWATLWVAPDSDVRVRSGREWTEIVLREGDAEVRSRTRSARLRPGERAVVDSRYQDEILIGDADRLDDLERWALDLEYRARRFDDVDLDPRIQYAAAPLADHGSWVFVEGQQAWQPGRVSSSWRPYNDGYWRSTPAGLTWVSYEPWGWVTHHYGSWDFVPGHGWVWYPGSRWAPAHVYWYWGPSYAGWCPRGYYERYYHRHRGSSVQVSFGFGIHGWIGGAFDAHLDRWSFARHDHLRSRHVGTYTRERPRTLERGILASDTRPIVQAGFDRPREALERLERVAQTRERELPDLTAFVQGRTDLSDTQRRALATRIEKPTPAVSNPSRPRFTAGDSPSSVVLKPSVADRREPDARGDDRRVLSDRKPTLEDRRPTRIEDRGTTSPRIDEPRWAPPTTRDREPVRSVVGKPTNPTRYEAEEPREVPRTRTRQPWEEDGQSYGSGSTRESPGTRVIRSTRAPLGSDRYRPPTTSSSSSPSSPPVSSSGSRPTWEGSSPTPVSRPVLSTSSGSPSSSSSSSGTSSSSGRAATATRSSGSSSSSSSQATASRSSKDSKSKGRKKDG